MSSNIFFIDRFRNSFPIGASLLCLQAPVIRASNRVSSIACHKQVSSRVAFQDIISGKVDKVVRYSFWHLQKGGQGPFYKTALKLPFKTSAAIIKSDIDQLFLSNPLIGSVAFSFIMVGMETSFNLVGVFTNRRPGILCKAAAHFGFWNVNVISGLCVDEFLRDKVLLNTSSISGILAKSVLQATALTAIVYPVFGRIKIECSQRESGYWRAFWHILEKNGPRGLLQGMGAKTMANITLVFGFNILVEAGKTKS